MKLKPIEKTSNFDLNIEEILENWGIFDGIREIIANAIDEQIITRSKDIEILQKADKEWLIRDYGRGIHFRHLTMNENKEKLEHPHTIGKFGIGLKDALATFNRKGVGCKIKSKYNQIETVKTGKYGFNDIETLHARISPPKDLDFEGTEYILKNVPQQEMETAKKLFLRFSGDTKLASTSYGEILEKSGDIANIYINGVKVAEETNFLFSYNITSLTKAIKKALNRERTNVGRSAYTDRVKKILLDTKETSIAEKLVADLDNFGDYHDEMTWLDIQEHAVKIYSTQGDVVFLSSEEIADNPKMVDEIKSSGNTIIAIPRKLRERIANSADIDGNPIRDLYEFEKEYDESFEYKFVDLNELDAEERKIYNFTPQIYSLIGGKPNTVNDLKISETMKKDFTIFRDSLGVYDPKYQRIIIKRSQLKKIEDYSGTLLHEIAHADSGARDVDIIFEEYLTRYLGELAAKILTTS